MSHFEPNTLTARDPEVHQRKRKRLAQALSNDALRHYEQFIVAESDELCSKLGQSDGVALHMAHIFDHLTFDIMTQIVFGKNFHTMSDTTYQHIIKAMQISRIRSAVVAYMPIVGALRLDRLFLLESLLEAKTFLTFIYGLMKSKLDALSTPPGDILSYLMALERDTPRRRELDAEAPLLIIGASDTTATTLVALFYYLSRYPGAYQQVQQEVRSTFVTPDQIRTGPSLTRCVYLRACIDEALRLAPPAPGPLIRGVPPGGMRVDGLWLPDTCEVAVSPYYVQRNPEVFDEPVTFKPSRWLVDDKDKIEKRQAVDKAREAFMPFSIGPRSCIGKRLGMVEVTIVAARILLEFGFRSPEKGTTHAPNCAPQVPDFVHEGHHNAIKNGPLLQFFRLTALRS
ncbi:hypothetical protein LTR86_004858 [Recurvomyces mirabilis]|nr:hypothetical protein LTR86_004858 [Recurvomyces mirabilis]